MSDVTILSATLANDGNTVVAILSAACTGGPSSFGILLKVDDGVATETTWVLSGTVLTITPATAPIAFGAAVLLSSFFADNHIQDGSTNPLHDYAALAVSTNPLSIKERVARRIVEIVGAINGVGTVYRWDMRGPRDPETGLGRAAGGEVITPVSGDAFVYEDDESVDEESLNGFGYTTKNLPVIVDVLVQLAEDDTDNASSIHNSWLLRLERALMADRELNELADTYGSGVAGERLAIRTRTTSTSSPPIATGQSEMDVIIHMEVKYEHLASDPGIGPGITQKYA